MKLERFPSGGGAAYLTARHDGPVLMWLGPGTRVSFGFNKAGSPFAHIDAPERFGGTPKTWAEFKKFAERFAADGAERRRGSGRTRVHVPAHTRAAPHRKR